MSTVDPNSARLPPPAKLDDPSRTRAVGTLFEFLIEPQFPPPRTERHPVSPTQRVAAKVAASLRRRWLSAVMFGLLGGWLAGAAILSHMPAQHRAEVWLQLQRASRDSAADADKDGGSLKAQELLIKSPFVLEAALRQPDVEALLHQRPQEQPLDWLDRNISVDTVPGQSIVRVIATSTWAEEPPVLALAVAQAFTHGMDDKQQARQSQLKEVHQQTQDTLRKQREALAAAEDPRYAQIESDRQQAQRDRQAIQAELRALSAKEKTLAAPPDAEIEQAIKADAQIREWQKEIDRLNEQIKAYERISAQGKNDPGAARLVTQRNAFIDRLAERRQSIAISLKQEAAEKARAESQSRREALETKLAGLDELDAKLAEDWNALNGDARDASKIHSLRDDIAVKQELVRRQAAELHTLDAEAKAGPSATQLGEVRRVPDANRVQRLTTAGVGAGAVFLMLALFVGWLETRDKHVKAAVDIGLSSNISILGTLPNLKTPPARGDTASGPEAEAVDVVRTLLLRRTGGGPCVVLVTSPSKGEGKTTLAGHLAASLARSWRKTLLVDGDLRTPAAHKLFGVAQEPGLCDMLRGDMEAGEVIQPTALSRLWLLPAGHLDNHAQQALAQQEGAAFLDSLREQYEFIVVDSGPVLAIADTLLLSQHADAVVLSVRCGTSKLPLMKAAHERLDAMNAPFLGAIVLGGKDDLSGHDVRHP